MSTIPASYINAPRVRTGSKVWIILGLSIVGLALTAYLLIRVFWNPTHLSVEYGPAGVQRIAYGGKVLEDLTQYPDDVFRIGHMRVTTLAGVVVQEPQYVWGENNSGKRWSEEKHAWTYEYPWGTINVAFHQNQDRLDVEVTTANRADSGVVFDGTSITPFTFHFDETPKEFGAGPFPMLSDNTSEPGVFTADFSTGSATTVVPSAGKPLYTAFTRTQEEGTFNVLISTTTPDGLASFLPHLDRPVLPGHTDHALVSYRFTDAGKPIVKVADDAYQSWAKLWPSSLNWSDRRPIGAIYLATSPSSNSSDLESYSNNPRHYFNDGESLDFDITNQVGLAKFQRRVLAQAATAVQNLRRIDAQGAITWDIEGEQYPQGVSYVCSPDQVARVAPEMESIIQDPASPYNGLKLDDAYFKVIRSAGFRVGVCVRPQQYTINPGSAASQVTLSPDVIADQLINKIRFAHDRWGATLFYLDSTVDKNGSALSTAILQQVARVFPDSLLIPEESSPKAHAYVARFSSFLFHGDVGTDPAVYSYYPKAFSVNMINDVAPDKLAAARGALQDSVAHGDILLVHAAFWQPNNSVVQNIYSDAKPQQGSGQSN